MQSHLGKGINENNPRQIVEKIHEFNGGDRKGGGKRTQKQEEKQRRSLELWAYDIADFFTNVPRTEFLACVKEALRELGVTDRGKKFF